MPIDLVFAATPDVQYSSTEEYVDNLKNLLCNAYRCVHMHTRAAAERQKKYYDVKVKESSIKTANSCGFIIPVLLRIEEGSGRVFECLVVRKLNAVNYVIKKNFGLRKL